MLSLKDFKANLTDEISTGDLGKFYGGADLTVQTTPEENPKQPKGGNFADRMHYDYCYDAQSNQHNDYRGGNYAL